MGNTDELTCTDGNSCDGRTASNWLPGMPCLRDGVETDQPLRPMETVSDIIAKFLAGAPLLTDEQRFQITNLLKSEMGGDV